MPAKSNTVRFTVSLPVELLDEVDARLENEGYASRSEFIRDLMREKMVEEKWKDPTNEVVGVLTISYDHHQPALVEKLLDVQHNRYVNVLYTGHVHLDHHNCLETIVIKGRPQKIEQIAARISGLRGIRLARLTRASAVEI
jgi:CopG family nickel-responsive transcriptional regulator